MKNSDRIKAIRRERERSNSLSSSSSSNSQKIKEYRLRNSNFFNDYDSASKVLRDTVSSWQSPEAMETNRKTISDMRSRLGEYSDAFSSRFTVAQSNDLKSIMDSYDSVLNSWDDIAATYGQYQNADAYQRAVNRGEYQKKYQGKSYDEIKEALKKAKNDEYDFLNTYTDYSSSADFDKAIANTNDKDYRKELEGKRANYMALHGFDEYKDLMNNEDFAEKSKEGKKEPFVPNMITSPLNPNHKAATSHNWFDVNKTMSDEKRAVGNYIYNTQGEEAYQKYLDDINIQVGKELKDTASEAYTEWTNKNGLTGTLGTLANITSSALTLPAVASELVDSAIRGEYNPYEGGSLFQQITSDSQSALSQSAHDTNELLGIGYDVLSTGLASRAGQLVFGQAYTFLMGAGAFATTYADGLERGLSPEKSAITAGVAGVAETFFEYFSFEKFKALKAKDATSIKTTILNFVKQFITEGTEEVNTDIANAIGDFIINDDKADVLQNYKSYLERGFTESEAWKNVGKDFAQQLGYSMLVGGLSGGISAGGLSAIEYAINQNTGANINEERYADALRGLGSDSEAYSDYVGMAFNDSKKNGFNYNADAELGNNFRKAYAEADTENRANLEKSIKSYGEKREERIQNAKSKMNVDNNAKNVDISDVKESKGEFLYTIGGEQKKASEVAVNDNQAEVISIASNIKNETERKAFLENYEGQNPQLYESAFTLAYAYGQQGYAEDEAKRKINGSLSELSLARIYSAGYKYTQELPKVIAKANEQIAKSLAKNFIPGTVDDSAIKNIRLSSNEKLLYEVTKTFATMGGVNLKYIYDTSDTSPNGITTTKKGEATVITVNLAARIGNINTSDNRYVIPTMAHELTHYMKANNMPGFNALASALRKFNGTRWDEMVNDRIKEYKDVHGKEKDFKDMEYDVAEEEVISRSCEDMLNDTDTMKRILSGMSTEEMSAFKKAVIEFFDKIKEIFDRFMANFPYASREARFLREQKEEFLKIREVWIEGVQGALVQNQKIKQKFGETGIADNNNSILGENTFQLSEKTFLNGGRVWMENYLAQSDLSDKDQNDILEQLDSLYKISREFSQGGEFEQYAKWQETDAVKNAFDTWINAIVSNGDYPYNIDFATVCKKRKALDTVLNQLVSEGLFDTYMPSEECLTEIIDNIKNHGFEVACALCFVDAKRYRVGSWANNYAEGFEDYTDKKNPKHNYGYNELVRNMAKLEKTEAKDFNFLKRDIKQPKGKTLDSLTLTKDSPSMLYLKGIMDNNKSGSNNFTKAKALYENPSMRFILQPAEIISSAGLDAIRINNPILFDMVKASSGSATPKLSLSEVAFNNEVAKDFANLSKEKQKAMVNDLYKVGGYRVQSFSDYMGNMVLDYVQLMSNFAACEFPAHAYTKEYYFVKIFGMTGMKINMSIVPDSVTDELKKKFKDVPTDATKYKAKKWDSIREEYDYYKAHAGLAECDKSEANYSDKDKNGKTHYWKYITVDESFPLDKALEIQNDSRYNKNCGIIWVGVSSAHIRAMLNDEKIPMVIPYHRSGINPAVAHIRGIAMYNDYTDVQNARILNAKGVAVKLTKDNNPKKYAILKSYNFYDALKEAKAEYPNTDKTRSIPQMAADKYLKLCKDNGIIPMFDEFADEDNYYKLLEDFRLYDGDGNYAPQRAVKMTFPEDVSKVIRESLEDTRATSNKMAKDQKELYKDARSIIRKYASEERLSEKQNSNGEELTVGQEKYFSKSKARDDQGRLKVFYHGTPNGEFHIFDKSKTDDGRSFFFTDSLEVAHSYSGVHDEYAPKKFESLEEAQKYLDDAAHRLYNSWSEYEFTISKTDNGYSIKIDSYRNKEAGVRGVLEDSISVEGKTMEDAVAEFTDEVSYYIASETNYKVYLNLENPLHIDADSSNWDEIQIHDKDKILKNVEYSSVQINDHNDGTYDVEYKDDMDSAKYKHEEFGSLEELESKFGKDILTYYTDDYGYYNMVHIDKDGFFFPSTTRGISDYASRRGYDGVIIDNLYDSGMDDYNAPSSQVAIAFESNQIKSVNNENPTEDADIRFSDKQEFSKEAEEFFGTTDNYDLAGYITLDGKLLDFSAGQGQRVMDHRDVADFYEEKGIELSNNTSGSGLLDEGMLRFMADGNIRFSAVHGIEIVKEPTSEQYETIRKSVRDAFYNDMSIDYSTEDGRYLGTTYYDEPNPTRVVNDIKSFFETGKVPEDVSIRFNEKSQSTHYIREDEMTDFFFNGRGGINGKKNRYERFKNGDRSMFITSREELSKFLRSMINSKNSNSNETVAFAKVGNRISEEIDQAFQSKYNINLDTSEFYWVIEEQKLRHSFFEHRFPKYNDDYPLSIAKVIFLCEHINDCLVENVDIEMQNERRAIISLAFHNFYFMSVEVVAKNQGVLSFRTMYVTTKEGYEKKFKGGRWNTLSDLSPSYKPFSPASLDGNNVSDNDENVNITESFSEKQRDPSYKILGENERLKKQITSLKQDVSDLTELVKLASKVTNGRVWTPTELTSAAETIAKSVQSTYDIKALREDLAKAYENITKWLSESTGDSEADMNYVMAQCTEVARNVLEASTYKPISDAKILSAIKKSNVDLGENANELVAEASEMIKRVDYEENLQKLATKIYQKYWTVHKIKTPTDVAKAKASDAKAEYNKRVKQIDAKHQAEMDKMRKALSDQRLADRIHYERMLNELRNNRDEKITQLKEFTKKRETERKDFAERKATIRKITDTSMTLNKWLRENNVKHPIPEPLKKPIAALLNAIDFSSKQLLGLNGDLNAGVPTRKDESFVKALEMVHSMALNNDAEIRESEFSELDLPENFAEAIDKVYKNVIEIERNVREDNGYILQLMSTEDLKELYVMVKALKTSVMQMNKFISTANAHSMDEIGGEFFKYADAHKQKKHDNVITDFFENGETTPYYFFKRLGKAGDFIFNLLANANDKETNLVGRIKEVADETYTAEEIKTWQKEIHEFTVLEDDGEGGQQQTQIRMTVPQMMSLYCLNRRQQAEGHLLGGGIRVEAFKDGLKTVNQVNSFTATQETINNIIAELSPRQKEVARNLQKFMSTECADWGNEVTMKRFGIKGFTEENYFPIVSDSNVLKNGGKERQKSLYALLNMSFTKALTKGANNQIVLQNIFDVFANHTSEMAKYSAWALPVLDTIRWWNYKERTDKGDAFTDRTVRSQMEYLLGTPANKYLRTLLDDLNGTRADERLGKIAKMTTRAYKSAAVGFNIQTALLQPISYWRATYKMPTKYLLMGLTKLPSIQKCQNNVALARWKSMGFFETDVSRGVASMIKHDETVVDKVIDASMKMAEWGDTITWGFLYNACEAEIRNTTNLVPNSNEFNDAVALRMRDIIYSTQVVDSTLTRSTFMRDPGLFAKTTTAFLSEPTLAVNVALDAYSRFAEDSRQYGFNEAFKRNGKTFAKAFEAVLITSIVESLLRAAIGKVREPEDDEAYIDSVLSHFREELNPLGKLPIFKDLVSVFQGYSVSRMDEAAFQSVYYAYKAFFKMLDEGADYKSIYRIAQAFSQLSGMPISAIMREGETMVNLWNMIVGNQYPSTKLD